jgi:hydrogenase maturation protein HypF
MAKSPTQSAFVTRTWRVGGQVQGVGFRPFVYRLASLLRLSGTVRNDAAGVFVSASGSPAALEEFARRLVADAPPLSRVDELRRLEDRPAPAAAGPGFRIEGSDPADRERGRVTVDAAVCSDCVRELFDSGDRRHRHPLVNCTSCGPRYTIVRELPYDRPRTTMAGFPMCPACAREYGDPADRRFHAQPVCCPECGPRVRLLGEDAREIPGDPFLAAARMLEEGGVLALKGLGGYHLATDASSDAAVARLRERKGRDEKPFAVMVRDLEAARGLARLSAEAEALLGSPAAPVVLAERREGAALAAAVAPGCHRFGLLLPYTPVHHLILAETHLPIVMTSFNRTDDPLVTDDEEALASLGRLCDAALLHDRPIERAVDDSVVIDAPLGILPLRRARGYVPVPLPLPVPAARPGLAAGGMLKGTVAVVRGGEVVLSQHLGDLEHTLAWRRFLDTVRDLTRLFDVRPEWIAADLHPDYPSTRWARARAAEEGLDLVPVQHHHAHLASLLAEHGHAGPAVGIVCDGVGYGVDGTAWGGEILVGDLGGSERLGRVRPLRLPGGDAAARETGRCALSWMHDLLGEAAFDHPASALVMAEEHRRRIVSAMLARGAHCPPSSGLGRLFDAAAALLSLTDRNHYEAMSGTLLEAAASRAAAEGEGLGVVTLGEREGLLELDHRPLLEMLLAGLDHGRPTEDLARLFHAAVADGLARGARAVAERVGVGTVGLSGGVFCNTLLAALVREPLEAAGLTVLLHRAVPPNDGGISYGQAAAAAARLAGR